MRNSPLFVWLSLGLSLLSSCGNKETDGLTIPVREVDFTNKSQVTIKGVEVDTELPMGITDIMVCDSFLVFSTMNPAAQVSVYSTRLEKLGDFCTQGRARNECLSAQTLNGQIFKSDDGHVMVPLNDAHRMIRLMDVTQSVKNGYTVMSGQRNYSTSVLGNDFGMGDNFFYIVLDNDINNTLEFYESYYDFRTNERMNSIEYCERHDTGEVRRIKPFESIENVADPTLWYGLMTKHPSRNLVVQPLRETDYMLFLDLDGKKTHLIHQTGSPTLTKLKADIDEVFERVDLGSGDLGLIELVSVDKPKPPHFGDVAATESFFMVLYWGGDYSLNAPDPLTAAPELLLFDWSGKFLKSVKLDKFVGNIAFDEAEKILYGLSGRELLYKFDLSPIF